MITKSFTDLVVWQKAHIAEGYKRRSANEKLRFYNIAQAPLEECRYYFILSNWQTNIITPDALLTPLTTLTTYSNSSNSI